MVEDLLGSVYGRSGEVAGALIIVLISVGLYLLFSRILRRLRVKGVMDRSLEDALRLIVGVLLAVVALPLAISLLFRIEYGPLISLLILSFFLFSLILSSREYLANVLSFIIFSIAGTLKEGEYVRIDIGQSSYEGRVALSKGEYMSLRTEHGHLVYVPYSKLHSSVITKFSKALVSVRLKARGKGLEVEELLRTVDDALSKATYVDRDNVTVELLRVVESEDSREVMLLINARISNPANMNRAREELVELLMKNVQYETSVSVVEE
ncbi:MAG: mechanosensitive ion channel family protein [Acidilobaceae archaeon]|nr:mechanosensitive ion channel family protein [Acidilobaceae archaeon]MCX8165987.1 mechanosensitive ion channel family protein [Acidilobaceae archaeon]MDW7974630.1 mechanosensitive ion channel family protein [Sulfolobales archaeon]